MQLDKRFDGVEQAIAQAQLVRAARRGWDQIDVGFAHRIALFSPRDHPLRALAFGEGVVTGCGETLALKIRNQRIRRNGFLQIAAQALLIEPRGGLAGFLDGEGDGNAGKQYRFGAQEPLQISQRHLRCIEVFCLRPCTHERASGFGRANALQFFGDIAAVFKHDVVLATLAPHGDIEFRRKGVGYRYANAVQAPRKRVGTAAFFVELATRMQPCENNFDDRHFFLRM